jgi:hypothetical protein
LVDTLKGIIKREVRLPVAKLHPGAIPVAVKINPLAEFVSSSDHCNNGKVRNRD